MGSSLCPEFTIFQLILLYYILKKITQAALILEFTDRICNKYIMKYVLLQGVKLFILLRQAII